MCDPNRATGRTTRAVLKAARDMSKGKKLILLSGGYTASECEHFMRQVTDLVGFMGFLDGAPARNFIKTLGGGSLRYFSRYSHSRGWRFDEEVTAI